MSDEMINETNDYLDHDQLLAVLKAVKSGDFSLRIPVEETSGKGREVAETLNELIDLKTRIVAGVINTTKEIGLEGKLGGQIQIDGLEGIWKNMVDCLNMATFILSAQLRNIAEVAQAVANRDMTKKVSVDAEGEMLMVKETINNMVDQLAELELAIKRLTSSINN